MIAIRNWLLLLSLILLGGFVINSSIDRAKNEDYMNIQEKKPNALKRLTGYRTFILASLED